MPNEDVKTAEQTTATATPSADEQTTTEVAETVETTESTQSEEAESKTVPYPRFKEVNEAKAQLEQRIKELEEAKTQTPPAVENPQAQAVKESLKALGFVTKEEQQAELARQKEDLELDKTLSSLEGKYNGQDGLPKFSRKEVIEYAISKGIPDPEIAFKVMKEQDFINYHVQQAIAKSKGIKTEASDGSGSANAGTSDADLRQAAAQGDKQALRTLLKRVAFTPSKS